jgi:hypothetical protein
LPTPEDRLLFILVYLKTNNLQVVQGELFGMPQNKANQWIHTLLPVLLSTMRNLGDAPARSLEELAKLVDQHVSLDAPSLPSDTADGCETWMEQAEPERTSAPLFAMMGRSDASSGLKTKMNRKTTRAARKNVMG